MEHLIEHAIGIYVGLLLLACLVGVLVKYLTHLPYTVALTIMGLVVAVLKLGPNIAETGFSRELIFFVMLPPLLFQGAFHLQLNRLAAHFWPIATFASIGLLISVFVIGGMFYVGAGLDSLLLAMLFGAMVTPTDPVSVLAIFKECGGPTDLRYIVEGESLFNDGVGIVVFTIVYKMLVTKSGFDAGGALLEFAYVVAGGLLLGAALGFVTFLLLRKLNDHLLENAICLVLAYGCFWSGEVLHVSGVIATVVAGLMIGNYGRRMAMSEKTTRTIETFFESIDFLINSLLFILIGLELQQITTGQIVANLFPLAVAIVGVLVSRALAVYPLYGILNLAGTRRPPKWAHVLFWGGLRGSIPIALLLGLPRGVPIIDENRPLLLVAGFGVVLFSLIVQGMTMKPLLGRLQLTTPA